MGKLLWRSIFVVALFLSGWVQAELLSSLLPGKRTVQVGTTATAFATILNTSSVAATGYSIAPATTVDAVFLYQTTNPVTNALTGVANTPVDIAASAFQTYLFAFTPNSAFAQTHYTADVRARH